MEQEAEERIRLQTGKATAGGREGNTGSSPVTAGDTGLPGMIKQTHLHAVS